MACADVRRGLWDDLCALHSLTVPERSAILSSICEEQQPDRRTIAYNCCPKTLSLASISGVFVAGIDTKVLGGGSRAVDVPESGKPKVFIYKLRILTIAMAGFDCSMTLWQNVSVTMFATEPTLFTYICRSPRLS